MFRVGHVNNDRRIPEEPLLNILSSQASTFLYLDKSDGTLLGSYRLTTKLFGIVGFHKAERHYYGSLSG